MYYLGANDSHIAIVRSVKYNSNGYIDLNSIKLIESTFGRTASNGNRINNVTNELTISSTYSGYNWNIVRLRRN